MESGSRLFPRKFAAGHTVRRRERLGPRTARQVQSQVSEPEAFDEIVCGDWNLVGWLELVHDG